jgi:hypothetical protein
VSSEYSRYPWYESVGGPALLQGDFLDNCPILLPRDSQKLEEGGEQEADVKNYDVVVMSQSCDLEQDKLDLVQVCPHWSLDEFVQNDGFLRGTEGKESLRRGNVPGYHMLAESKLPELTRGIRIVDFHNVYGLPLDFAKGFADRKGKRLRLLPPYREHLSQAFARFFMRVGLPSDIPKFTKASGSEKA